MYKSIRLQIPERLESGRLSWDGLLTVLLVAVFNVPVLASSQTQTSSCDSKVNQQTASMADGLNTSRAVALALGFSAFQRAVAGKSYKFNSIFNMWAFNSSCVVTDWKSVNVVFSAGSYNFVVSENSELGGILNVTIQHVPFRFNSTTTGGQFAGYMFYNGPGTPVLESLGYWTEPTVYQPYSGGCTSPKCGMALWVGLTPKTLNASSGELAQGGTFVNMTCSPSCYSQYYGFYEFLNTNPVYCTAMGGPQDSMSAEVYNQAAGGGSVDYYNIDVDDTSIGISCTVNNQYYAVGIPFYAEFLLERHSGDTLPQFTQTSITAYINTNNNQLYNVHYPYSNYWDTLYIMNNGAGNNVGVSGVSSNGVFTLTWKTSNGT